MVTDLALVLIPVLVSCSLTWALTRRWNNARRKQSEMDTLSSELDIYKTLLADNKQFLQESREQIAALTMEVGELTRTNASLSQKVDELTRTNEKMDGELKQLRKLVKQNINENKLQRDCPD